MAIFKELTVKGDISINGSILQNTENISKKYAATIELSSDKKSIILKAEDGTTLATIALPA